ncbi:LPS export ABC transporter ATP-binding protein [Thiothrix litoralis]|jgi:lipopolysaccharide export system ATP-binding protein|uniref:Lipopolysaccharide export system ATP-binding protein LptB n=1 Tax=Thiothrix litoralis TaxID=2891210 RepID=A0ABX7WW21_9GAMM|nr:LPS export ABC transporter ATP-binding protein [Thiothrix litoralis]QTR47994.1 LPS export ABC transporter ATP-binding protein [Thiothrix litoralis]
MNTLTARNLQKSYKKRQILKGVDLHVNTAEVVGLLGPNGAGKTTCFYIIVGLVGADAGQVLLNDKDITAAAMHERAREGIGYLPQEASIFRKLTVAQNIMAVLELRKELNRSQRQAKVDSLLEEFQLTHLRDSQGISLSGGERRRAEIARALASEPAFILLDEPFAGVDPISVLEIQKIIRHLVARDIGVLITDHNVRETLGICHRAYILSEGKILVEGSPDDILQNEQARRVYLGENFKL